MRRLLTPTLGLALSILVINLAAFVAYAVRGEGLGLGLLAIVGLCDVAVGLSSLLRAVPEVRPARPMGNTAVALGVVSPLVVGWPDPIYAAARLVSPTDGQAIGEGFITAFVALSAVLASVAIVRRLRFQQRRSS